MSEIAKRAWREPAVFLGLITSVALAVITVATGDPWDTAAIAAVIAPILEALGVRQLVTPAAGTVQAEIHAEKAPNE